QGGNRLVGRPAARVAGAPGLERRPRRCRVRHHRPTAAPGAPHPSGSAVGKISPKISTPCRYGGAAGGGGGSRPGRGGARGCPPLDPPTAPPPPSRATLSPGCNAGCRLRKCLISRAPIRVTLSPIL